MEKIKLIKQEWNPHLKQWEKTWYANDESAFSAGFDPDSACGSIILVIATSDVYVKNANNKWQLMGSNKEV